METKFLGIPPIHWIIIIMFTMMMGFAVSMIITPEELRGGLYSKLNEMNIDIHTSMRESDHNLHRRIDKLEGIVELYHKEDY